MLHKRICVVIVPFLLLSFSFSLFSTPEEITFSFNEREIRDYLPVVTNNITADKIYARIAESGTEIAYEFFFYWEEQEGSYKFAQHEHDWEFIVVYTYPNGTVFQVNFDEWHYYIGRTENPDCYNDTNVLLYVDPDFHYFKPDRGIRSGNVTWQINNQSIYELTDSILQKAEEQVGFDSELYKDPFKWKEMGFLGRYTAFSDWWRAFFVVLDKKFDFIDLSNEDSLWYKWL